MNRIKLLYVEDDAAFTFLTKSSLELTGRYDIRTAANGKEALEVYRSFRPDVIVSDIEMPVMDGMEMVARIRRQDEQTPILFATGRTRAGDVIEGYKLQVDNFIKKPYVPQELDAHIQAVVKRLHTVPLIYQTKDIVRIGSYRFNPNTRLLQGDGEMHELTAREAAVLWKLYEQKGRIVKRETLLEDLWGTNDFFTSRSLDVFINTLRKYLAGDENIHIQTLRGVGLRLMVATEDSLS
jgi:DNA-binding response OmpR family regulator